MSQQTCNAFTKEGEPCKNYAQDGSDYCHVHQEVSERNYAAAAANTETVEQIENQISEIESTVDAYHERGEEMSDEAKAEVQSAVQRLREHIKTVRRQLATARETGSDAINDVWAGYQRAWKTLQSGVSKIRSDIS